MMKRIAALLLCLCLLCGIACAEEDITQYFDSYASRVGRIYFTMESEPDYIFHDVDLVRTEKTASITLCIGWTGKIQLHWSSSNSELQYHIADISGTVAEMKEQLPEADELTVGANALSHFAQLSLSFTGAKWERKQLTLTQLTSGDVTLPMVTVDFGYDDTPGVAYRCIGLLDGAKAVLMLGTVDARYEALTKVFGIITPEQEAVIADRLTPAEEAAGPLAFTMPAQDGIIFTAESMEFLCFTEQYHMISVEYMPVDIGALVELTTMTDDDLLDFTRTAGEGTIADGGFDSLEVDMFQPRIARAKMVTTSVMGEEQEIYWFLVFPHGCYTIRVPATEEGEAFLNGITLNPEGNPDASDFVTELLIMMYSGE